MDRIGDAHALGAGQGGESCFAERGMFGEDDNGQALNPWCVEQSGAGARQYGFARQRRILLWQRPADTGAAPGGGDEGVNTG